MHRTLPLLGLFLPLLACDGGAGLNGQFGEEENGLCVELSRTPVPADAPVTVMGLDGDATFAPADITSDAAGTADGTLSWGDPPEIEDENGDPLPPDEQEPQDSVPVTTTLTVDVDAVYELVEYTNPDGLDLGCPTLLESTGTVTVTTEDAVIDASHTGRMVIRAAGVSIEFAVTDDSGDLDPQSLVDDPALIHPTWYRLHTDFGVDGAASGRVLAVDASGDTEEDAPTLGRW